MSKRRKKPRRVKSCPTGRDRHHIIFTRRDHERGYNGLLRKYFIYSIPIKVHRALHQAVEPVPVLPESDAKRMWEELQQINDHLSLFKGLKWLRLHAPNSEFAMAIMAQEAFLRDNLKN